MTTLIYVPKKQADHKWVLVNPINPLSVIGFFKSRKTAMQYVIDTLAAHLRAHGETAI